MTLILTLPENKTYEFTYSEDLREKLEDLWNEILIKKLPNDEDSFIMLQETEDKLEDHIWEVDFHTESELSDDANELVNSLLKETGKQDLSDQIMSVIGASVQFKND